jgi:hypothetical protein
MKTKNQHYISEFILRRFLNGTNFQLFDKTKNTFLTKGASNSMAKKWFYEHKSLPANKIEKLLAQRENLYKKVTEKLIKGEKLNNDDYTVLIEFRHVTYYRSNEFIGFHDFRKSHDDKDYLERGDWRSVNGFSFFKPLIPDELKQTQIRAIQSVIKGSDAAFSLSLMTKICFVYTSTNKKFFLGDSGSIGSGEDEFNGAVFLVISPHHLVGFPRTLTAAKILTKMKIGINNKNPIVLFLKVDDDLVDSLNLKIADTAFEYYIDPNR